MKRRIIGMLLVVVTLVLTLESCAFNYASEDMTEYADFKKDEFIDAINKLVIDDGDFTTDEEVRKKRVEDYILAIASKVLSWRDHCACSSSWLHREFSTVGSYIL